MKLFAKHQPEFANQWDLDRLRDRVRTLENNLIALQRETVYFEDESPDEKGFVMIDQRPRINLKSIVLALVEHLGMNIKVEPAKPPSAKLTRKID